MHCDVDVDACQRSEGRVEAENPATARGREAAGQERAEVIQWEMKSCAQEEGHAKRLVGALGCQ